MIPIALALLFASPSLHEQIQHTYDGYADACLHHDIDRTMAFLTDDVVWRYPGGAHQDRAQIRPDLEKFCRSLGPGSHMRFQVDSVEAKPDGSVVALIAVTIEAPLADGGTRSKPPARWRDTWVKTKSGWRNRVGELLPRK